MGIFAFISEVGKSVYGFVLSAARRGLSARQTLFSLREQGLGYRTQVFYRDFRNIKRAWDFSQRMRNIPRMNLIPDDRYLDGYSLTENKYLTNMRVKVRDITTGEERNVYVTVGHDTPKKRYELEDIARDQVEKSPFAFISATPMYGIRNLNAPI